MIEPLRISFEVESEPGHAFRTWTERASAWWPPQHTASNQAAWEPPRRLAYLWHIATDPAHATEVEITFTPTEGGGTRVAIEHGGWDRLAERGRPWRDANRAGWDGVLPAFVGACANPEVGQD